MLYFGNLGEPQKLFLPPAFQFKWAGEVNPKRPIPGSRQADTCIAQNASMSVRVHVAWLELGMHNLMSSNAS